MTKLNLIFSLTISLIVYACVSTPKKIYTDGTVIEPLVYTTNEDPVDAFTDYKGVFKTSGSYKVLGKTYTIQELNSHKETGLASFYGDSFHGRSTASGAKYDNQALTAAHKTFPIPSIVKVTNLENGRVVTVLVNDRGPFAEGRVIDLSKKAAQALGVINQGLVKVDIELLKDETENLHKKLKEKK